MDTVFILIVIFILIVVSIMNSISVLYPLAVGLIITGISRVLKGYSFKDVCGMALDGVKKTAIIFNILMLIGIIISVWIASGTVPGLMYYGFMIIKPGTFVLTAFILTMVMSMLLGTSFGTVSTIGIALMAVGRGFGINPCIISGAIISGAYVGDRSSPMSSSAILTSALTESKLYDNLKYMMTTLVPAVIITAILYYFTGGVNSGQSVDISRVMKIQEELSSNFYISLPVLIPPLVIMILPLFKVNIKINIITGIVIGGLLAVFIQKVSMQNLIKYAILGYNRPMSGEFLSEIIKGGGLVSMVKALLIIAVSSALNGIFESTKMLEEILGFITKKIKGEGELVLKSALISIITAMYGCSQTLSIMMTGYIMKPHFKKLNISREAFARTIADTSVVLSALIPWNIASLVPAASLGVKAVDFIPYAYICFILPAISIVFSYFGYIRKDEDVGI